MIVPGRISYQVIDGHIKRIGASTIDIPENIIVDMIFTAFGCSPELVGEPLDVPPGQLPQDPKCVKPASSSLHNSQ